MRTTRKIAAATLGQQAKTLDAIELDFGFGGYRRGRVPGREGVIRLPQGREVCRIDAAQPAGHGLPRQRQFANRL